MVKLENGGIRNILPTNLITPETLSVSHALEQAQKRMFGYAQALHLYTEIGQIPERILDLLALEMGTQYYDQTLERSAKERLVMQTLVWYMRAGTPSVLNEFLGTVLEGGSIKEWYTYGGDPYYFRAYVQTGDSEIPLGYGTDVKRYIGIYKNVRSWLEYLMFVTGGEFEVPVEYGSHVTFGVKWYPLWDVPLKLNGKWKQDGERKLSRYEEPVRHYRSSLTLRSRTNVDVQPGTIRITVTNKLDSTWRLNEARKLNGGLYLR